MKKINQILIFGLALTIGMSPRVWADTEITCDDDTGIRCWTCGATCKATLYSDGKLLINGSGSMTSHSYWKNGKAVYDAPWAEEKANITSVEIKGVSNVGSGAFAFMDNITEVKIGNTVGSIDSCAFCNMHGLHSIDIPDSVRITGDDSFHNTTLTSVTFGPESQLTTIKNSTFENSGISKLVVPPLVTSIGNNRQYIAANKMYCTGAQIQNGVCSSQANYYELDDGMYIVYNSDGTINGIYESNKALIQGLKVDEYTKKDENGNPLAVYDGRGNLQMSYGYNQDGSVSVYDANGKLIGLQGKRILTVDEASALVKNNKNTFKLKYR